MTVTQEPTPPAPVPDPTPCPTPAQSARKAIAAAATAAVVGFAAKQNIDIDPALAALIGGTVAGFVTYKLPNRSA